MFEFEIETKYDITKEQVELDGCYKNQRGKYENELAALVRYVLPTKDYTKNRDVNMLKSLMLYYTELHYMDRSELKYNKLSTLKDVMQFIRGYEKVLRINKLLFIQPVSTIDMQQVEYLMNRAIKYVYNKYRQGGVEYPRIRVYVTQTGDYSVSTDFEGHIDFREEYMDKRVLKGRKAYREVRIKRN